MIRGRGNGCAPTNLCCRMTRSDVPHVMPPTEAWTWRALTNPTRTLIRSIRPPLRRRSGACIASKFTTAPRLSGESRPTPRAKCWVSGAARFLGAMGSVLGSTSCPSIQTTVTNVAAGYTPTRNQKTRTTGRKSAEMLTRKQSLAMAVIRTTMIPYLGEQSTGCDDFRNGLP